MQYKRNLMMVAGLVAIASIASLLVSACSSAPDKTAKETNLIVADALSPHQVITIGDIDPDDPGKKITRFTPLADYLAENLKDFGVTRGEVVIAQDMEEMAEYLLDGTVDVYFDSAFPTLNVQSTSNSQVILRRWKESDPTYWSLYVALTSSDISSTHELRGKVVAFEEPHSTSGFILPAGSLIEEGLSLMEVDRPEAEVPPDKVGYFFTWDEENTLELLLREKVAAGAFSNQDYDELPEEIQDQLNILGRTAPVPRQLVSVRPGLDPQQVEKIKELLIGLDQFDEGRFILEGLKGTRKFDLLPADSEAELADFVHLMALVSVD